jgi:hypothetical protein
MVGLSEVTHVGFSGSREGMSPAQEDKVREYLLLICMNPGTIWLHHGDCIGADAQAHEIAKEYSYKIHLHPPLDPKYRAFLDKDCDIVEECWSYHGRNQRILKKSQILIATPKHREDRGGGTWYTINKAMIWKVPYIILFADGTIRKGGVI